MAKSQNAFIKNEKEKKRLKKQQEKQQKKEDRKSNPQSSSDLENMLAFVDENGNLTDKMPDPTKKKKEIDAESIDIGVPKREENNTTPQLLTGKVDFFNDSKGYGFIKENNTKEKYFVHINNLLDKIQENDKVSFELEKGLKGLNAIKVKKI